MELNELTVCMDVKLDIYDKRPDSLKFKAWTRCQVKIEAIKCLPCFLRITIQSLQPQTSPSSRNPSTELQQQHQPEESTNALLCVSINVPGVTLSLATSRTKQYSYGLFWTHNRRDCFIYFASDTEVGCRKHMKWIRKSIKNLEVYRQVFLEQRRNSRGPPMIAGKTISGSKKDKQKELSAVKDALSALGPLPEIPVNNSNINWSQRGSRASDIYEEIFEGNVPPRLSRRLSRASIASGIYEEMRPCSQSVADAILEEHLDSPPPLPPLPAHRKRINTFESDSCSGSIGDIPRSNTNPETDLVKKKKYKNVLDNIFGTTRSSKRSESVSESQACTIEDIIAAGTESSDASHIYANDILQRPNPNVIGGNKRNSFSSPDLSKINFLDTFDEEKIAAFLLLHQSNDEIDGDLDEMIEMPLAGDDHNFSSISLDDSSIGTSVKGPKAVMKRIHSLKSKAGSMESLNISEQLPQNFNFSACNTSSINLVGSSGAVPSLRKLKRNKIVIEDDLTGYCIMAPIQCKKTDNQEAATAATSSTTSSTSSGYSTGSYCSTTSSGSSTNTNSSELNKDKDCLHQEENRLNKSHKPQLPIESDYDLVPLRKTPLPVRDQSQESNIYENMHPSESPINISVILRSHENTPPLNKDFSGNLYENLLTIKAAQELEQPVPANRCTSTPTEVTGEKDSAIKSMDEEQENYYQTPRKSLISVDDKIPSYYPNSCDTMKMKRGSISPTKPITPVTTNSKSSSSDKEKPPSTLGLKHLVSIKMKRERKENLYISSPQKILEQRKKTSPSSDSSSSSPKVATTKSSRRSQNAQKISENVYAVNLNSKRSTSSSSILLNNNNNTEKISYNESVDATNQLKENLNTELLQLALLQNIDFKFDDAADSAAPLAANNPSKSTVTKDSSSPTTHTHFKQSGIYKLEAAELEYENCYRATKDATRLLHKYATLAPKQSMRIKQQLQHHLQVNQMANAKDLMTQSTKVESPISGGGVSGESAVAAMGSKKFASLPRFKKIDFSPLKLKINNVLQRNQQPDF